MNLLVKCITTDPPNVNGLSQRNSSGTYKCTAENSYHNGERGTHSQSFAVNVQCKV